LAISPGSRRSERPAAGKPDPVTRLVVSEFMTLDGVMEAPGFEEHRDGKNAWALHAAADDQQRFKVDELFAAGAILLGRVTYQIWAAFWPDAPRDEGFADRINSLEKYVVSTTLREPTWNNTKVIRGDLAGEVARLKERSDGDILVFGSAELVDSLLELDLVDELRIMVFPVVLGSGKRLFRDERDVSHLRLVGSRAFDSGVVLLLYEPRDEGPSSKYIEAFAWTDGRSPHGRPRRTPIECSHRSCSPMSSTPPAARPPSGIVDGAG
jgi:dihydrofolate reductase